MLVEIGGTVGDIESLPFLEAIRQFRQDVGRDNTLYIHLTLVPFIGTAGELKTKPTQHSVRDLRSIGIQPDILLCRTDRFLDSDLKRKIALFCDVDEEAVITAKDVATIYEVPLVLAAEGLDRIVLKRLHLPQTERRMQAWEDLVSRIKNPLDEITIHVVGKYVGYEDSYKSLNEALYHGGFPHRLKVNIKWIEAEALEEPNGESLLDGADGILVPGGFGDRGTRGMMKAAQIARERRIPYFGICYGFQWATVEYARNVAGLPDADSTECAPDTPTKLIYKLRDLLGVDDLGGTMRLGSYACELVAGLARAARLRRDDDQRAPSSPLRVQLPVRAHADRARSADFRAIAGRQVRRDRRVAESSVVPRRPVPSGVQVEADAAASALRGVRRRSLPPQDGGRGQAGDRIGGLTGGRRHAAGHCRLVAAARSCSSPARASSRATTHATALAGQLVEITARAGVPFIFKASFDKANRTSGRSFRGPGLEEGLRVLAAIKARFDVPLLTDIHEPDQADAVGRGRRRAADSGVPVAADRSHRRRGADRSRREHQEGTVSRARRRAPCGGEGSSRPATRA